MKQIISVILFFVVLSCEDPVSEDEPYCITTHEYIDYTIKYGVTGTACAVDLTIENEDGGTSQYDDRTLPWTYSFESKGDTWVYCSAQNQCDIGSVRVTIYVNDEKFKSSLSDGAYVIASAHGTIDGDLYTVEAEECY